MELDLKVVKVGLIKPPSKYILVYPEFAKDSLAYKAIAHHLSIKLKEFDLTEVENIKESDYKFVFTLNSLNNKFHNNIIYNDVNNNETLIKNILNEIEKNQNSRVFTLDVYKVTDGKVTKKVMEGYTREIVKNNTNILQYDRSTLDFVMCSIDALFDKNIFKNKDFQEYYYKCF